MKLWSVKVNNWGWNEARTMYAASKAEAQAIADQYPAADKVEYAGNFREATAKKLLDTYSMHYDNYAG